MLKTKLLTTNIGDDSISIIDIDTPNRVKTIFLKDLKYKNGNFIANIFRKKMGPLDLVIDANSNLVILNSYDESVIRVDESYDNLTKVCDVGKNPVCIKIYNGKIYVLNCDSNSLSIIDEKTNELIEEIFLGERPCDLQLDIIQNKLYIAISNENCVTILNLSDISLEHIRLNSHPIRITMETEKFYVLSYLNNGVTNYSSLSTISKDSFQIKSNSIKGIYIDLVKIGDDEFLLTNPEDGYIYKFDNKNGEAKKFIYVGGMPNRLMLDNERNCLYVTDLLNNYIFFIDLEESIIRYKIRVGKDPQGIILL